MYLLVCVLWLCCIVEICFIDMFGMLNTWWFSICTQAIFLLHLHSRWRKLFFCRMESHWFLAFWLRSNAKWRHSGRSIAWKLLFYSTWSNLQQGTACSLQLPYFLTYLYAALSLFKTANLNKMKQFWKSEFQIYSGLLLFVVVAEVMIFLRNLWYIYPVLCTNKVSTLLAIRL